MKKFLVMLLAFAFTFAAATFVACEDDKTNETDPPATEENGGDETGGGDGEETGGGETGISEVNGTKTLNEWLDGVGGKSEITVNGTVVMNIGAGADKELGADAVEEITLVGSGANSVVRANGENSGEIRANGNGKLIFEDITFEDSAYNYFEFGWKRNCIEFGGKLRFENCTFNTSIFLGLDTDAEFINCTFNANEHEKIYSVWICDGNATFTDCAFTGYRALKFHEETYAYDIETVTVDGCTFTNIEKKPGLALGTMHQGEIETQLIVQNCSFVNCANWSTDCITGVNGFYETDTALSEFTFTATNNEIDGVVFDGTEE